MKQVSLALALSALIVTSVSLGAGKAANATPSPAAPLVPSQDLSNWCKELNTEITRLKWNLQPCDGKVDWKISGYSSDGRPLVYAEVGNSKALNVTLILAMVHGDEVTPVYIAVKLAEWIKVHENELKESHVIVAPLINPDGFYLTPKTRMNARGVDVNRNFATQDWQAGLKRWKSSFRSDPRRNPGDAPRSEHETLFQEELIRQFKPQKIMSIHAPLNHMDYDGPTALSLKRFPSQYVQECLKLQKELKAKSTGFFPGSLGNYAGRELGIPTITLELPTADARKAETYWKQFSTGIRTMIQFSMPNVVVSR